MLPSSPYFNWDPKRRIHTFLNLHLQWCRLSNIKCWSKNGKKLVLGTRRLLKWLMLTGFVYQFIERLQVWPQNKNRQTKKWAPCVAGLSSQRLDQPGKGLPSLMQLHRNSASGAWCRRQRISRVEQQPQLLDFIRSKREISFFFFFDAKKSLRRQLIPNEKVHQVNKTLRAAGLWLLNHRGCRFTELISPAARVWSCRPSPHLTFKGMVSLCQLRFN